MLEPPQRAVEQLDIDLVGIAISLDPDVGCLTFGPAPAAHRVEHRLAHDPRTGGKKVLAIVPAHLLKPNDPQGRFVDKLGRLQGQPSRIAPQHPRRRSTELVVQLAQHLVLIGKHPRPADLLHSTMTPIVVTGER